MKKILKFLMLMILCYGNAQMILMDQGVRVKGLWLFPSTTNPNSYHYLPNEAVLGTTPGGLPQLSLLRYVALKKGGEDRNTSVTQADGGAILHFLVKYHTDDALIAKAQEELRKKMGNEKIKIKSPVIFDEASFALVSSILKSDLRKVDKELKTGQTSESEDNSITEVQGVPELDTKEVVKEILTVSTAPVLEGGSLAFSFKLTPRDSKILLESLKMATPDVSLVFQLKFSGFSDAYKAKITADWDQVYKHTHKKESKSFMFYKEEATTDIKELITNRAVKLEIMGDDDKSSKLFEAAYNKILELVYEPIDINKFKSNETIDDLERAWKGAVDGIKDMATMGLSSMGSSNGYQYREIKQSGVMTYSLNKANKVSRHHFITFNVGNLFKRYGNNKKVFNTVNILDPDYMQRDVFISLDGSLRNAFTEEVNSVNITVKKKHKNGEVRTYPIRIDKDSFEKPQAVAYGNQGDFDEQFLPGDMENWKKYEFEVVWDFKGGYRWIQKYQKPAGGDINLYVPYQARNILLEGDLENVWATGVKVLVVDIEYDFFGKKKVDRVKITPKDTQKDLSLSYLAPLNRFDYKYKITRVSGNNDPEGEWKSDNDGVIILN